MRPIGCGRHPAHRFQPKAQRTDLAQVDELVRSAKTSVFFIDDLQAVRPDEVGSTDLIREAAFRNDAEIQEFELETQFRCAGSKGFVSWVDNTLGLDETANPFWDGSEGFDFQIVDSVEQLDAMIRSKADEGHTARLVAGFCWPWSNPLDDGTLVPDVKVGAWQMPWNAKSDAGRLADGIPQERFWASDPRRHQPGRLHLHRPGLRVRLRRRHLRHRPPLGSRVRVLGRRPRLLARLDGQAREGRRVRELVKRTYRVLLTRGMKGCYVYFQDGPTEGQRGGGVSPARRGRGAPPLLNPPSFLARWLPRPPSARRRRAAGRERSAPRAQPPPKSGGGGGGAPYFACPSPLRFRSRGRRSGDFLRRGCGSDRAARESSIKRGDSDFVGRPSGGPRVRFEPHPVCLRDPPERVGVSARSGAGRCVSVRIDARIGKPCGYRGGSRSDPGVFALDGTNGIRPLRALGSLASLHLHAGGQVRDPQYRLALRRLELRRTTLGTPSTFSWTGRGPTSSRTISNDTDAHLHRGFRGMRLTPSSSSCALLAMVSSSTLTSSFWVERVRPRTLTRSSCRSPPG